MSPFTLQSHHAYRRVILPVPTVNWDLYMYIDIYIQIMRISPQRVWHLCISQVKQHVLIKCCWVPSALNHSTAHHSSGNTILFFSVKRLISLPILFLPLPRDSQNDEFNTVRLWGAVSGHALPSWWLEANPTLRCSSIKTLIPRLKEWKIKKHHVVGKLCAYNSLGNTNTLP